MFWFVALVVFVSCGVVGASCKVVGCCVWALLWVGFGYFCVLVVFGCLRVGVGGVFSDFLRVLFVVVWCVVVCL